MVVDVDDAAVQCAVGDDPTGGFDLGEFRHGGDGTARAADAGYRGSVSAAEVFVKRRADAPVGFFAWEAAGLRWLAEAARGPAVVAVADVDDTSITLARIATTRPDRTAAQDCGRQLAALHAAGAEAFGAPPPQWTAPTGWIGRQALPLGRWERWGEFYAQARLLPYARAAVDVGHLDRAGLAAVERVCHRLITGEFDDDRAPARIHGDLWGGNLLYRHAPTGAAAAVLIDPAAHGGHGQTDLAMLELFGTPHLDVLAAAYAEAAGLPADWPTRTGLHQLHPLLVHAVSHGPGYGRKAVAVARRYG